MVDLSRTENPVQYVTNFQDLVSTPFNGKINAICWTRKLTGDFCEIDKKVTLSGNITEIEQEELCDLQLSKQGLLAREILLNDLKLLKAHGASPVLNVIKLNPLSSCADNACSFPRIYSSNRLFSFIRLRT